MDKPDTPMSTEQIWARTLRVLEQPPPAPVPGQLPLELIDGPLPDPGVR